MRGGARRPEWGGAGAGFELPGCGARGVFQALVLKSRPRNEGSQDSTSGLFRLTPVASSLPPKWEIWLETVCSVTQVLTEFAGVAVLLLRLYWQKGLTEEPEPLLFVLSAVP